MVKMILSLDLVKEPTMEQFERMADFAVELAIQRVKSNKRKEDDCELFTLGRTIRFYENCRDEEAEVVDVECGVADIQISSIE